MSDDAIIEGKKALIESFVEQVKDAFELKDVINIVYCPQYTPMGRNAIACIEPATMTMYISIIHLRNMSFEDIRKTVFHEITHKFELEHNPNFERILNELLAGLWTPFSTSGLTMIDGGGDTLTPKKPKMKVKEPIDKTHCNYHLCRKKTEVKRCIHCRDYFCEEHIKPVPPELPNFDYPNKFEEWKNRESAHPCPSYYMYLVRKSKENIEILEESFNRMNKFGRIPNIPHRYKPIPIPKEKCPDCGKEYEYHERENWFDKDLGKIIDICPDCWRKRRGEKTSSKEKSKEESEKKCSYCSPIEYKDTIDLTKCEYCDEWFCEKHIGALTNTEAYQGKVGHPCSQYEDQIQENTESLSEEEPLPEIEEVVDEQYPTKKMKTKWKAILITLTIIACASVVLISKTLLGI